MLRLTKSHMLYCLLYLCCPRMYHDLFVADRPFRVDRFRHLPPDEFRDVYAEKPVFTEITL